MPQLAVAVLHVLAALAAVLRAPSQEPGGTAAPTVVLEGRVVDVRGEPVAMAEITVTSSQQREVVLAKGTCDGDGAFRIARVPPAGRLRVAAHRDGYARVVVFAVDEGRPLRIELPDATTVQGVVRDSAGKPVAGAQVHATSVFTARPPVEADARADASGAFTLRDVPLGMVHFAAAVPGEGLAELRQWIRGEAAIALAPALGAATTTLQVAIEGIPPDALGAVSTSIMYGSEGCTIPLPAPWDTPVFDNEGRFELRDVPDTGLVIRMHADGFVFSPAEFVAKAGAGPHRVLAHAGPLLKCPVRVCDRDGSPVAGIRCGMGTGIDSSSAISAPDGMVTFTTAAPVGRTVSIQTQDPLWVGRVEAVFDPANPLELRVEPACRVRGRIVQPDGRPAPFAGVFLRRADAGPGQPSALPSLAFTATDRDGNFEIGGLRYRPDRLRVTVAGEYGAGTSEQLSLAASGEPVTVPPVKLQAPATITGTVHGPAPGVRVVIIRLEGGKPAFGSKDSFTDRDGRFRIAGVPPGSAEIWIKAIDSLQQRRVVEPFEVEAGKQYAFELEYGR